MEALKPLGFMDSLPDTPWQKLALILEPEPAEGKMEEGIEWVTLQKKVAFFFFFCPVW